MIHLHLPLADATVYLYLPLVDGSPSFASCRSFTFTYLLQMVVMVAHGTDIASEIGGYFLEKNMVVSKVFGTDSHFARFIITKFHTENSLVD